MTWSDVALSLALGMQCVACSRPGRAWCRDCSQLLEEAVDPQLLSGDPPVVACTRYAGCVPAAVVGYKDHGVRVLGAQLGRVLAAGLIMVLDAGVDPGVVVPVTSTSSALRRRGFDHMGQMAAVAAEEAGLACEQLLRNGRRADQAGLAFTARRRNVRGTARVRRAGVGPVILVDDVRTSGATLAECTRALRSGGYTVSAHVVVAATNDGPGVRGGLPTG